MVTVVVPEVVPVAGVNEAMVGTGATNLKLPTEVAVPPTVVTFTFTVKATWGLVTALMVVELVTVKLLAVVVPNLTAVVEKPVPLNPVPVMVTVVVPDVVPVVGVNEVMVGTGATNLKSEPAVAVPPAVVTYTVTVTGAWVLVTALMVVGDVTVKLLAVVVPNFTEVAPMKPVPVMVTVVVPEVVPVVGVNEVMVGTGATNLKSEAAVAVPPAVVTFTATVPGRWLLVTALMVVGDVTVKLLAVVVPNFTEVAPMKPVPVIVTVVVPEVVPVVGVNEVMVGTGATNLKSEPAVAVPPAVVI